MEAYFLKNLAELAARRAISIREEAQLWDVLSRELKREAKRREDVPNHREPEKKLIESNNQNRSNGEDKLYVGLKRAAEMMGISKSSLYVRINAGDINVRKAGKRTLVSVTDIKEWFSKLPKGLSR